jgi:hypothetical protein
MERLQQLVADLLERRGALVEPLEPEGLAVMATPELQQALRLPDFCRLGFGASPPEGWQRVGIEGDWLARLGSLLGDRGRRRRLVLPCELPALAGVDRLLEHELALGNAPVRLVRSGPAWTRYLVLEFRYSALSDERRDGLLRLGLNLATGGLLDGMLDRLLALVADAGDADPPAPPGPPPDLPPDWDPERLLALVERALPPRLDAALQPFVAGLQRRMARDQDRLHSYHADLHQEASRRLRSLASDDAGRQREQLRLQAVEREYRAKLDDLGHKYALSVTVEWLRTLDLAMPVHRLELLVRRRKGERLIRLDWNPLSRKLEQLDCEFSHGPGRERLVCDDAMHIVSPAGLAACAGCARPYCRACHPAACPRCGHADVAPRLEPRAAGP